MLPERQLEALSLTITRAEQQVKASVLLDRNSGFLNADTLVIKITVRILKETEVREYSMCKQVVVYTIFIYIYILAPAAHCLISLPTSPVACSQPVSCIKGNALAHPKWLYGLNIC